MVREDPAPTGSASANQRADLAPTGSATANHKAGSAGPIVTPLQAHPTSHTTSLALPAFCTNHHSTFLTMSLVADRRICSWRVRSRRRFLRRIFLLRRLHEPRESVVVSQPWRVSIQQSHFGHRFVFRPEVSGILELGNVWVFVQLIFGPH